MQSNILSARFILGDLLNERSILFKQLEQHKSVSCEENNLEIKELEEEIHCRTAQIQDLQQKILDMDGESTLQVYYLYFSFITFHLLMYMLFLIFATYMSP